MDLPAPPAPQNRLLIALGVGVIISCLALSGLFAWGIYLDLQIKAHACATAAKH